MAGFQYNPHEKAAQPTPLKGPAAAGPAKTLKVTSCYVTLSDGKPQRLPPVRLSLERQNHLAKTRFCAADQPGTFKESTGIGDWKLTLEGICLAQGDQPDSLRASLKLLDAIASQAEAFDVKNELLTLLGIYRIVATAVKLQVSQEQLHSIRFQIRALSDPDFMQTRKSRDRTGGFKALS